MADNNSNDQHDQDIAKLKSWGIWLTFLWLVFVVLLLSFSKVGQSASPWHWPWMVIVSMNANELGDFLAGGFAPLAFFWLVITVLIQGKELREQRMELREQRAELEETRGVFEEQSQLMKAQTQQTNRSADLLAAQNDLIRAQNQREKEQQASQRLAAILHRLGDETRCNLQQNNQVNGWSRIPVPPMPRHSVSAIKGHLAAVLTDSNNFELRDMPPGSLDEVLNDMEMLRELRPELTAEDAGHKYFRELDEWIEVLKLSKAKIDIDRGD